MTSYVATMNVPGYLPEDDDPAVFDDIPSAWAYLAGERERAENDAAESEHRIECQWHQDNDLSDTYVSLRDLGIAENYVSGVYQPEGEPDPQNVLWTGLGTIQGYTPGRCGCPEDPEQSSTDLGVNYSVSIAEGDGQ